MNEQDSLEAYNEEREAEYSFSTEKGILDLETEIERLRGVVRKLRDDLKDGTPDCIKPEAWWGDYNAETDRLCGEAAEAGGD